MCIVKLYNNKLLKKITNCSLTDCHVNILETVYNIFYVYSVFVFVCFFFYWLGHLNALLYRKCMILSLREIFTLLSEFYVKRFCF